VTWDDSRPTAVDLYYDPVVDEHVGGSLGIIAPAWYFAPQRPEVAKSGWDALAAMSGVAGDGPVRGLDQPPMAATLL